MLERYNRTLKDSILQGLESERIIRINSLEINFLNENLEDAFSVGVEAGTSQGKLFKADLGSFSSKYTPIFKKALEYFELSKYVPVVGDIVALVSLAYRATRIYSSANIFTNSLLEVANINKSEINSFIGQYSMFDASPEDIEMVADSLRQNIDDEGRRRLKEDYYNFFEELKDFIIDLALGLKTVSAGTGVVAATILNLTPSEILFKNLLFKTHKYFNDLISKSPEFLKDILKILSMIFKPMTIGASIIPIISFFSSSPRIAAFSEIDLIIDSEQTSTEEFSSYVGKRYGKSRQSPS